MVGNVFYVGCTRLQLFHLLISFTKFRIFDISESQCQDGSHSFYKLCISQKLQGKISLSCVKIKVDGDDKVINLMQY